MKTIFKAGVGGLLFYLLLLCSCATQPTTHPDLPAETSFNRTAGRGDSLFVMLRLEDGTELPFMLDTGCYYNILDKSLESKLGKRFKTQTVEYGWLGKRTNNIYESPKLYLNNVALKTGHWVWTDDVTHRADCVPPLMGILGMHCLQHYCIQFDFAEGKMRFLDPDHLDTNDLGNAFEICATNGQVFVHENLLGVRGAKTIIDTADYDDGALEGNLFEREFQNQKNQRLKAEWTDAVGRKIRELLVAQGSFGDEVCTNLLLRDCSNSIDPKMNVLGLRFLARHLVTLNFPKQTMYLKQSSIGPLSDGAAETGMKFLKNLKEQDKLPGWSKDDKGNAVQVHYVAGLFAGVYPLAVTLDIHKNGDAGAYHYTIARVLKDAPWRLQKAWRTGPKDNAIEEYPIP